jgi:hypothetical protein
MMIVGSGQVGGVGPVIAASDGPVLRIGGVVRVAMEGTLEKEHEEETSQHPRGDIVDTPAAGPGGVGRRWRNATPRRIPPVNDKRTCIRRWPRRRNATDAPPA